MQPMSTSVLAQICVSTSQPSQSRNIQQNKKNKIKKPSLICTLSAQRAQRVTTKELAY